MKTNLMSPQTLTTLFAVTFAAFAANAGEMDAPKQDVMLGGDATLDACSSLGRVSGLKDVKGNFLALRSFPGTDGALLQELPNGQDLWLCDQADGWFGVIVPDATLDCGNTSPITDKAPYSGPCTSGWVYGKFVELEAG
jgi:hypothetical protein